MSGEGELCTESLLVCNHHTTYLKLMHVVSSSFNINKSVHGTNSVSHVHMLVTSGLLCELVGQLARCDLATFSFPGQDLLAMIANY